MSFLFIGQNVRLPNWTDCTLEIVDIGEYHLIGNIYDTKLKKMVQTLAVYPLDGDWEVVDVPNKNIES